MSLFYNGQKRADFFNGIDSNDTSSVAIEGLSDDATKVVVSVDRVRRNIEQYGMCLEYFNELEDIAPGILYPVKNNRLTINPSMQECTVALEAIGRFNFGKLASGGLSTIYSNFVEWLVSRLSGHGSLGLPRRIEETWVKARRKADALRKYEFEAEQHVLGLKRDGLFDDVFDSIKHRYGRGNDRRVLDILSALEDAVMRAPASATVPLTALANYCFVNDAIVQDYRTVSNRVMQFKLTKKYAGFTTGLMATRAGLPGALLIKDFADLDSATASTIVKISASYLKVTRELSRMPRDKSKVEAWMSKVDKELVTLDRELVSNRKTAQLIKSFTTDSSFVDTLSIYSRSTIGFWYDTSVTPQGVDVIDPNMCIKEILNIFDMNNDRELQALAKGVETSVSNMSLATRELKAVNVNALDNLLGKYNSHSAKFREYVKRMRSEATMQLRLFRIIEAYASSHVRAYRTVKPATAAFDSAAKKYMNATLRG